MKALILLSVILILGGSILGRWENGSSRSDPSVRTPEHLIPSTGESDKTSGTDLSNSSTVVRRLNSQTELLGSFSLASRIAEYDQNVESGYLEKFLEEFHSGKPSLEKMNFTVMILEDLPSPLRRLDISKKYLSGGPLNEALDYLYTWYKENDREAAFYDYTHFPPGRHQGNVLALAMKLPIVDIKDVGFRVEILQQADSGSSNAAELGLGGAIGKAFNSGLIERSDIEEIRTTWGEKVDMAFRAEADDW